LAAERGKDVSKVVVPEKESKRVEKGERSMLKTEEKSTGSWKEERRMAAGCKRKQTQPTKTVGGPELLVCVVSRNKEGGGKVHSTGQWWGDKKWGENFGRGEQEVVRERLPCWVGVKKCNPRTNK